jgi:surface antigen
MKRIIMFVFISISFFNIELSNPIYVDRGCNISEFVMDPSDPYILGDNVILSGKSNCGTVRFEINGQPRSETGQPNQSMTWNTSEWGSGNFDVCFVARGEGGWENADRNCRHVYVEGGQAPPSGSSNSGSPVKCWVNSFTVTPNSVGKGEPFHLSGQGQCDGNARACSFSIDGKAFSEFGGYQNSDNLGTNEISVGNHELCFIITGGDWSDAAKSCVTVKVTQDGQTNNGVIQGEQTTNNLAGQTSSSGPDTGQTSSSSPDTSQQNYLSRDVFGGWPTKMNQSRVYVPSDMDTLRFRVGPGKNEDIFGYVQAGDWYILVSENSDWAEIETSNGTTGWVDKQYIRVDHIDPASQPIVTTAKISTPTTEKEVSEYSYNSNTTFDDSPPIEQDNSWNIVPQAYAADICNARSPIDDGQACLQCVEYVQTIRKDALCWLGYNAVAEKWNDMAQGDKAKLLGITVDQTPKANDIVVWEANCIVDSPSGHVAIVTGVNSTGTINVAESNGLIECQYGTQGNIEVTECMSFIHEPNLSGTDNITSSNNSTTQIEPQSSNTQNSSSNSWFCKLFGFIFPGKCGK